MIRATLYASDGKGDVYMKRFRISIFIGLIIYIFAHSCHNPFGFHQRPKISFLTNAISTGNLIKASYKTNPAAMIFEGKDIFVIKVFCANQYGEGQEYCPAGKHIFNHNYYDWYYNGKMDDFLFIGITKYCPNKKCSVVKVDSYGVYWKDNYASPDSKAKNINAEEIDFLCTRALKPNEIRDNYNYYDTKLKIP